MVQNVTVSCAIWWYSMAYQYHWIPDVGAPFQRCVWIYHLTQQVGTLFPFTEKTCKIEDTIGMPCSKTNKSNQPCCEVGAQATVACSSNAFSSVKVDDKESRCDPNSLTHIQQRFSVVPSNYKCRQTDRIICLPYGKINGKVGNRRPLTETFIGRTVFS